MLPRAPEPTIISMGLNCCVLERAPPWPWSTSVVAVGPDLDLLLDALAVGDDAAPELLLDLVGLVLVAIEDRRASRSAS